ncbi:MAG: metalloregulator ArsR/SmtB family transcription factor [Pseudomonadota bacterium]
MSIGLSDAASIFRALADPVRLRLLALCARGAHPVGDLVIATEVSQPRVSQQLKVLTGAQLVERFRDGQFVYYRLARNTPNGVLAGRLLAGLLTDSDELEVDLARLRRHSGDDVSSASDDRSLNRAVLDCLMGRSVGRLLDIGSGEARMLSLLSADANEAIGVDLDADARRQARRRLGVAGLANCFIHTARIESLPFDDQHFDTVIIDDVLRQTDELAVALGEASRVLNPAGLLLIIERGAANRGLRIEQIGRVAAGLGLRLAPPRAVPGGEQGWWLTTGGVVPARLAS